MTCLLANDTRGWEQFYLDHPVCWRHWKEFRILKTLESRELTKLKGYLKLYPATSAVDEEQKQRLKMAVKAWKREKASLKPKFASDAFERIMTIQGEYIYSWLYVDLYGALNHLHKIPYHLSLLGSSETL